MPLAHRIELLLYSKRAKVQLGIYKGNKEKQSKKKMIGKLSHLYTGLICLLTGIWQSIVWKVPVAHRIAVC